MEKTLKNIFYIILSLFYIRADKPSDPKNTKYAAKNYQLSRMKH